MLLITLCNKVEKVLIMCGKCKILLLSKRAEYNTNSLKLQDPRLHFVGLLRFPQYKLEPIV